MLRLVRTGKGKDGGRGRQSETEVLQLEVQQEGRPRDSSDLSH